MTLALAPRPDERLTPLERLEVLCDANSLSLLRTGVRSDRIGDRAKAGDGVLAASGRVDGRTVFCFAQDGSFTGGALGERHADTIVRVHELAARARVPVIGFIESAGARMQEGLAALAGYARIFRQHVRLSGEVPQISIVCGAAAGGACYGPALTDFVIMAGKRASMFLTGPGVVAKVTGEDVDADALGGPGVHERNGVCHLVAASEVDGALLARDLLDHLPQNAGEQVAAWPAVEPPDRLPDACVPSEERRVYDIREVARTLLDGGRLLEVSPRHARNVVCALARLDGRAVGVVANQPRYLGGVLDAEASTKAARFVRSCNLFGLPLLVLVDTPGFLPGRAQERSGVIRHGAKLVHAFAEASVPRITLIVRKAYGGAYIAMNSKDLGADYVFAWPSAQLGVMGATQAVEIIKRREIEQARDPRHTRDALAAAYAAQHLTSSSASSEGFVDEVIPPSTTRARLSAAFMSLEDTRAERGMARNLPL
jgi:acetyl-CoA carboxylase carboxyltransferase component